MNKIGEYAGIEVVLTPEAYKEAIKQKTIYENEILNELQNQNIELQERIEELEEEIIDLRADYGTKAQVERDLAVDKIEELQNRIDKVIEYISKHNCIATNEEYMPKEYEYCCSTDLLEILKGEK